MFGRIFTCLCLILLPIQAIAQDFRPEPELSTGLAHKVQTATSTKSMVVTAHPEATKAARVALNKGGNAIDAMVAAQITLGLVEPQSSGLGGGAFLLYYDADSGQTFTLDGRETAPINAPADMFLNEDGTPMGFYDAVLSGQSVGVPGTVRLLDSAHSAFGDLPWNELFDETVSLAEKGFTVTPRLAKMVKKSQERLAQFSTSADYFSGAVAGQKLVNVAYAETLKELRDYGSEVFYEGIFADDLVKTVQAHNGYMTLKDVRDYQVIARDTLCDTYREYKICSMNEPSSGGLALLQILKMLERFDLSEGPTLKSWHAIIEASRLAFADRAVYMADSDFVNTPNSLLLAPQYIEERSALIGSKAMETVSHGVPEGWEDKRSEDVSLEKPGTSHISIIDDQGNIVSMTTTIESAFGSHIMVGGFLLNNELTDFSFIPEKDGKLVANRIEGGKRPRSSMAPTIVFDPYGEPFLVIGSAGGSRIIGYVLQRIIAMIDWDMSLEDALAMPHILSRGGDVDVETGAVYPALNVLGHVVNERDLNSGLTAIHIEEGRYIGGADPRREGVAK